MKKLFYTMSALLLLASCTDDYKDWTAPQQIIQPAVTTFGDGSIAALPAAVNLNDIPAGQDSVQVCTVTAPTTTDASYAPVYIINFGDASFELDEQGRMAVADLQQYVADKFGRNPNITRTLTATVEMWMKDGDTSVKMATSDSFEVKAVAEAPFIDPNGYYIVGNVDGWACKKVDAWHLVNNGGDVYENPVFSYLLAPIDGIETYEIKFIPASAFNGDGTIGNWDIALSALKDVDEVAYEGRFSHSNAGGNIKFDAKAGANFYNITLNLLDATYKVEPVSYAQFVYFIGATDGWSTPDQKLESPNFDGKYTGFLYVADPNGWGLEFKFQKRAGDWADDSQLNSNNLTAITGDFEKGSDNIKASAGEGIYYVELDLQTSTLKSTYINNMNLVGDFNGWNAADDAQKMTWNATEFCYEISGASVTNAGWKFTANNNWAINLGGTINNLVGNGDNLSVVGSTIKLYPTRKTSEKIYCTVE